MTEETKCVMPAAGVDWHRLLPRYWMQNYPTDRTWDTLLNELIDTFEPKLVGGEYYADFGGVRVWVSNWPYAYGSPELGNSKSDILPKVSTRLRLRDSLNGRSFGKVRAAISAAKGDPQ